MKAVRTVKIEQFKPIFEHGKTQVTCRIEGSPFKFYFDKKKMGFGYRHYFICSTCGKYCVELVQNGGIFACFGCAGVNPYRGIQTTTRGGDQFIAYKMQRLAQKCGIENFRFPFLFWEYERPKYRKSERWCKVLLILQALESMRNQSIFFGKIWNVDVIKSVETGKNEYLRLPAIYHLKYFYPYDGKPQVDPIAAIKQQLSTV